MQGFWRQTEKIQLDVFLRQVEDRRNVVEKYFRLKLFEEYVPGFADQISKYEILDATKQLRNEWVG